MRSEPSLTSDGYGYPARYAPARRLRVDQVGACLLASAGGALGAATTMARALPAEDGRMAVVMSHGDAALMPELAEQLQEWLPLGWDSVRLVAAYAATPDGDDPPAAQELSDMLGVEVLAPDGPLLAVPGGSLFVLGPRNPGDRGAWWRFRPGRPAESTGRRFPRPEWEPDLSAFNDPGVAGVIVEEIPAGLWMHWPGEARPTDLAFALPVNDANMALVVSRAGDPPLRTNDLRRVVQALPDRLYDRLTVVPYGDEPVAESRLGPVVSLAANRTLRVRTGMPLYISGRGSQVVAVGPDGVPTWRPFAREVAWRPHGGSRILSWAPPAEQLLPAGHAQLLLNERWLVEVIESGLWVREVNRVEGAAVVRQLALDSGYCTVVVGVEDEGPVHPPWRTIVRMLRRLPLETRLRLRLVVHYAAGPRVARAAARACNRVVEDGPVCILMPNGDVLWRQSRPRRLHSRSPRDRRVEPPRDRRIEPPQRNRIEPPQRNRIEPPRGKRVEPPQRNRVEPLPDRRAESPRARRGRPAEPAGAPWPGQPRSAPPQAFPPRSGPARAEPIRSEPARPVPARTPVARRRSQQSPQAKTEAELMGFVEELRRTPAWDEPRYDDAPVNTDRPGPPAGRPTVDAPPVGTPAGPAPAAPPRPPLAARPPAVSVPDLVLNEERDGGPRPPGPPSSGADRGGDDQSQQERPDGGWR
jgi:hypothetical protein